MTAFQKALCAVALVACGSTTKAGSGDADSGTASDSAANAPDSVVSTTDGGEGTGSIDGAVNGTAFGPVGASYFLGAPDDPSTTVVYAFSSHVQCSELASPGWDTRIANGTQVVELKMFGSTLTSYKVVTTLTPAPGEASVNETVSTTSGTPMEQSASGGTVTLTELKDSASAAGTFALVFGASHLDGTFDAVFCPGGHEP